MIAKVTKLEYLEGGEPPLAVTFECPIFAFLGDESTAPNPAGEHTNLFPPAALADRIRKYDLEDEVQAVEAIIRETCSRHGEDDITVDWNGADATMLAKHLAPIVYEQDFSYLYFG